jgi:RimJ/RimL family protein N-acetyltransferase
MSDLTFKRVTKADEVEVFNLIDNVLESLERKEFFIPYSEAEKKIFFDDQYAYSYGAYDNGKLIAINQIFLDKSLVEEYCEMLNIDNSKIVCELGGFLVLREYWGKGIMTKLSEMQYKLAKELDIDYIVATAHPDNIGSCKVLEKLGMNLYDNIITSSGYLRNLYFQKLK